MKTHVNSFIITIGVLLAVFMAGNAYKYKFRSAETITVTGMAEVDFTSDLSVWSATFTRSSYQLKDAYNALKADETAIKDYLNSGGIADSAIIFSSVNIQKDYRRSYDERGNEISVVFSGYVLTGKVNVETPDIARLERLSREITGLLEKGIELNSNPPFYYYTRLNELKIDLLAKAASDARVRAETIAKNSGGALGGIKKSTMGVFQITGKNSNEDYSYGGVFNTSAKEKTASITLKVDYLVK